MRSHCSCQDGECPDTSVGPVASPLGVRDPRLAQDLRSLTAAGLGVGSADSPGFDLYILQHPPEPPGARLAHTSLPPSTPG